MDSNKIQITLNDNDKPCIKFRHNDKSNDDLLIGLFVKEAMQNGLKISSPDGFTNTTTGESFENYVIEPAEPKLVNEQEIINAFKTKYDKVLINDDKDLRIKELESEVRVLKITNQVQADLFNGKLKDIITVSPDKPKCKPELKATLNGNELVFSAVNKSESIKETEEQLQANLFKKYKELESSAAITVLNAAIAKLIESNKEPVITKQDIINETPQRFKTGLADDEQPEPIQKPKIVGSNSDFAKRQQAWMSLIDGFKAIKDEAEPSELEAKAIASKHINAAAIIQNDFANEMLKALDNHVMNEVLAELKTIIKRDQEIKDKLKVAFAEHSKALTEAIETNKRIETLIINL